MPLQVAMCTAGRLLLQRFQRILQLDDVDGK